MPKPALRRIIILFALALLALIAKPLSYDLLAQGAHAVRAASSNVVAGDGARVACATARRRGQIPCQPICREWF